MIETKTAELQPLQSQHVDAAWQLTRALSWPHRLEDLRLMQALGHGAVAASPAGVVGTAMWWPYGAQAATIGMIIVDAAWRGGGLGRRLLEHVLEALAPRSAMLNATAIGVPLYRSTGFAAVGAIHQYQAPIAARDRAAPLPSGVRRAGAGDIEAILALDAQAFGAPRDALLGHLAAEAEFLVAADGPRLRGFACRRPFGRGTVIGPVVTADEALAATLVEAWLGRSDGFVRVDIPGDAAVLAGVLAAAGLAKVDEVVTMHRGPWPAAAGVRIYGLASQSFG